MRQRCRLKGRPELVSGGTYLENQLHSLDKFASNGKPVGMNTNSSTTVTDAVRLVDSASADTTYTFTGQFLESSAIFVRRLRDIESLDTWSEAAMAEHRGLACAVIMQSAAALETETHEVAVHGPGSHLGSNGTDSDAQRFLAPIAEVIDDQNTIARFDLILHLLGKQRFDKGVEPYQSVQFVVRLRNELVHYKSRWGLQMESTKLYAHLESLRHKVPPFTHPSMNFFPLRCLSADCADWALSSVVAFLESFYSALGVPSRFQSYRARLIP